MRLTMTYRSTHDTLMRPRRVNLPEKMIRKCFGGKEKEYRAKKGHFIKKVLSAFFRHNVSEKRSVCG